MTIDEAREAVMQAALSLALAERQELPGRPKGHPYHRAHVRYCQDELAVAARELVQAVESKPHELPIGW
ncbi:hypothetical protein [Micromonospora coerulea]|uniref:hypothetical protein n=1 Tax=Micromonospora coerulea TaxID=47856 RepID=UPI001905E431|nr:hypothetical protein [Micromonospora veneta]